MTPQSEHRETKLTTDEIVQRLLEEAPLVQARIEALERAARKPTWKQMNDWVVDL